jgi:hypothetical protein
MVETITNSNVAREVEEKLQAERAIEETPLLEGVEGVRVELGYDHSGDAALWLIFRLKNDQLFDDDFIGRFIDYSGELQTKILQSGLDRFPYTRLERAA